MKHFAPRYNPWDQRVCLIPDGDFFAALRSGKAQVKTDTISKFTSNGILLDSGEELKADVIVTATGLTLQENFPFSTIHVTVDGKACEYPEQLVAAGVLVGEKTI